MAFNNTFNGPVGQVNQVETLHGNIVFNAPESITGFNAKLDEVSAELNRLKGDSAEIDNALNDIASLKQQAASGGASQQGVRSRLESIADTITKATGASESLVKIGKALGTWAAMAVAIF